MSKAKAEAEKEAVLLALDQLSQTMEVMRKVVGRLKRSIEQHEHSHPQSADSEQWGEGPNTLH